MVLFYYYYSKIFLEIINLYNRENWEIIKKKNFNITKLPLYFMEILNDFFNQIEWITIMDDNVFIIFINNNNNIF